MGKENIKPPIGVMDKKYYDIFLGENIIRNGGMCAKEIQNARLNELKEAIERYMEAKKIIDIKWVQEYNDILKELGILDISFTLC